MRFSMPIVAVLAVLTTLPAIAADPPDQNARRIAATDALSIVAAPGWSSCDPAINQKIGGIGSSASLTRSVERLGHGEHIPLHVSP